MDGASPKVIAVIPVKSLDRAKSRLAPHLDPLARRRLVLNMLRQVVKAATSALAGAWVVSLDPLVEEVALNLGARWLPDEGSNVNESTRMAFRRLWAKGAAPLYLPSDLPFLKPADLVPLAQAASSAISPSQNSGGTNALLLPQASSFRMLLGPGSFHRHLDQAKEMGLDMTIHRSSGLALDLDTWEDVQAYEEMDPGFLDRLTKGEPDHGTK
jgi:2-phospho-L-lactate guanylyltransferase